MCEQCQQCGLAALKAMDVWYLPPPPYASPSPPPPAVKRLLLRSPSGAMHGGDGCASTLYPVQPPTHPPAVKRPRLRSPSGAMQGGGGGPPVNPEMPVLMPDRSVPLPREEAPPIPPLRRPPNVCVWGGGGLRLGARGAPVGTGAVDCAAIAGGHLVSDMSGVRYGKLLGRMGSEAQCACGPHTVITTIPHCNHRHPTL